MEGIEELDNLLAKLDGSASDAPSDGTSGTSAGNATDIPAGDAIDQTLATEPRTTATRRLRDDPVMTQFREQMAQGVVRADTVRGVLGLIAQVLDSVLGVQG